MSELAVPVEFQEEQRDNLVLSGPQSDFFLCEQPFPLFVAGYGSGKSTTLAISAMNDLRYPNAKIAVYAPTYDLLKLVNMAYFEEYFETNNIPYQLNKTEYTFNLGQNNKIICRSLDNPNRIVGYQVMRSHVDELDTLPSAKARAVWNKIVARNRQKVWNPDESRLVANRVSAYTTPEGFQFCYDRWVENQAEGYVRFHAPSYSNPALPASYLDALRATYGNTPLVEAYIEGRFVNLTSGLVYWFDSKVHSTTREWDGKERLHIGMDFNVNNMNAVSFVQDIIKGRVTSSAVDELTGLKDTPDMITAILEKYRVPPSMVTIYPDASGKNTSSKSASKSDITLLKAAGFRVKANTKNPYIKDRVISVNVAMANQHFHINTVLCPDLARAVQQQVYDATGKPEKHSTDNVDDINDACGYYIYQTHKVIKSGALVKKVSGF